MNQQRAQLLKIVILFYVTLIKLSQDTRKLQNYFYKQNIQKEYNAV